MNEGLLAHPLDLDLSDDSALDLFAEELPEQLNPTCQTVSCNSQCVSCNTGGN